MSRIRVITMTAVLLIGIAVWLPGLRSPKVAAQSSGAGMAGSYGFSITAPYTGGTSGTGVLQGAVTLDGAGNATTSGGIIVSVDSNTNASVPQVQPLPSNPGTYSVNPDGTGTMTFHDPSGRVISLSFVITDGGSQLMLVVTGGLGNVVGTGIARKQ
jgi:hypothetical protein